MITTAVFLLMTTTCGQVNVYGGQNTIIVSPPARSAPQETNHRFVDLQRPIIVDRDPESVQRKQSREELHERAQREREQTLEHRRAYLARRQAWRAMNAECEREFELAWTRAWINLPGYNPDLDASVIYQMNRSVAPYRTGCAPGWGWAFPPVPPSNGSYFYGPSYGSAGQTTTSQGTTGGPG